MLIDNLVDEYAEKSGVCVTLYGGFSDSTFETIADGWR